MLKHIEGFDQFQGQSGTQLLGSLAAAGYTASQGMAIAAGRHSGTYALEMQLSPGAAGSAWSMRTNNVKSTLRAVATNNNGRWIAVGDGGVAASSGDTIAWGAMAMGVSVTLTGICHTDGRWIAVGDQSTILISDDDGANWSTKTSPLPGAVFNAVAAGGGKVVIVGSQAGAGVILVSSNKGDTWSVITVNAGDTANLSVAYGGGTWLVGGSNGRLRSSPDASVWTTRTFGATTAVTGLAFGDDVWMAPSGRSVRISSNGGQAWSEAANSLATSADSFTQIMFTTGRWVIAGLRGMLMTSDNRTDWSTRPLTGSSSTSPVNALAVSSGAQSGMVAVGGLIGSGQNATALLFASLSPPTTLSRTFNSTAGKVVIGCAHRATSRGRILTVEGLFDLEWPAGLSILGQASTAIPIRNAWYYYELVIDKVAKTVALFVNDTADIVVPLPDAVATQDIFKITWMAENGAVARLDDIYLLDSATTDGATLVDRLKPIRIPLRLPTEDSDVNWEGSVPGPHATLVGLLPPSETNFVRSAESGAQELFTSTTALPPSASTILAVGVLALAKKSDLDNRQLGLAVGAAGPNQREVIDTTLSVNPEYSLAIFEKAPGNVAWTAPLVTSTPFGVIVRP